MCCRLLLVRIPISGSQCFFVCVCVLCVVVSLFFCDHQEMHQYCLRVSVGSIYKLYKHYGFVVPFLCVCVVCLLLWVLECIGPETFKQYRQMQIGNASIAIPSIC